MKLSVRSLTASALIAMCGGCATGEAGHVEHSRTVTDGPTFSMQPGDNVTLPDASRLRYVELVADSRCPTDVQCVWAGDAEVRFTREVATRPAQTFSLHTGRGARSQDFEGRRLTLVSLARGARPQAELQLAQASASAP